VEFSTLSPHPLSEAMGSQSANWFDGAHHAEPDTYSIAGPSSPTREYYTARISSTELGALDDHAMNILAMRQSSDPAFADFEKDLSTRMEQKDPDKYGYLQMRIRELEESEDKEVKNEIERRATKYVVEPEEHVGRARSRKKVSRSTGSTGISKKVEKLGELRE